MTTASIQYIIARLEKATGPDRELDYRLAYSLGWRFNGFEWQEQSRDQDRLSDDQFRDLDQMAGGWKRPDQKKWPYPGSNDNEVPRWTASIDAALTLIPGGWDWLLAVFQGERPTATIQRKGGGFHAAPEIEFDESGASPAIGLCIAAIKAIAAQAETATQEPKS